MRIQQSAPAFLLAGLLAAAAPAHAQLIKCVTPQGKTVYQDQPCEVSAKQSTLKGAPTALPSAPAEEEKDKAKDAAAAPDKPIPELTLAAIEVVVGNAMCTERVPGFSEQYSQAYDAWKRRNQSQMERMNQKQEARWLNERLRIERTRTEGFEERCAAFGAQLAASGPAAAAKQ